MNPFEFFIPQNIIVGAGTLVRLPECAQKLGGTHAMLLSGPTLRKMGIVDKAAKYLEDAGMKVDIFTEIEANPSVTTVEKATTAFKEAGADFIVALGGGSVLAVQNVAPKETNKYGIVGVDDELKQTSCVRTMVEKPAPEAAPSTLAVIGRYVLEPEIFTALEHVDRGVGGEIQLTDAIASLLGEGKTYAHRFEGRRFDCGSKQGFLTATAHYARLAGYDFI